MRRTLLLPLGLLIAFQQIQGIISIEEDCSNEEKPNTAEVRLKKKLLCGYDLTARPVKNHKDPIQLNMRMVLKYFEFNIHDNSFTVHNWLALYWKDVHLTWNPDDYESVKIIHLSDSDIWLPDLSVYNRRSQEGNAGVLSSTSCIVSSDGTVICVPPSSQTSVCVSDLSKYPFDVHNCTVRFGSWVHSGEEIDLAITKPGISKEDLISNGEWEMIGSNVYKHPGKFKCCPNNTYPSINFSFKIRRLTGAHTASAVLPAIALLLLTLVSFWIEPQNSSRMILCSVILLCEFLYVQYISWVVPLNGKTVPLILLFARDSLLLSSFTIALAVFGQKFVSNKHPAPSWVSAIVSTLASCKICEILLMGDASAKELASVQDDDDGKTILENHRQGGGQRLDRALFTLLLDRICFLIYVIIYFVMIMGFAP